MNGKNLINIISDGYNMGVKSITPTHVKIAVGGTIAEFSLEKPLAVQIDSQRKKLGCTPLSASDKTLIAEWQKTRQAAAALGSIKSQKKAAASAENGKRGGRPKKAK